MCRGGDPSPNLPGRDPSRIPHPGDNVASDPDRVSVAPGTASVPSLLRENTQLTYQQPKGVTRWVRTTSFETPPEEKIGEAKEAGRQGHRRRGTRVRGQGRQDEGQPQAGRREAEGRLQVGRRSRGVRRSPGPARAWSGRCRTRCLRPVAPRKRAISSGTTTPRVTRGEQGSRIGTPTGQRVRVRHPLRHRPVRWRRRSGARQQAPRHAPLVRVHSLGPPSRLRRYPWALTRISA